MENTTESTASSSLIALKYGFISGLLSFLFSTIVSVMGWAESFQESIGWISSIWTLLLSVTITLLCAREFREQNEGYIGYGQGLGLSTLLGAISGLVGGGFNYVYIEFIDNSVIQRQLDLALAKMEDQGLSGSVLRNAEDLMRLLSHPGIQFVSLVISSIVFGFFVGLIVSAIVKREKPIFD